MIKLACRMMSNNKLGQEVLSKVDLAQDLLDSKVLTTSLGKEVVNREVLLVEVNKVLLEIFLKNLKNSLVEGKDKERKEVHKLSKDRKDRIS